MELAGKKLGIIGMGRIGQSFAKRAQAFGMKIYYHNRRKLATSIEQLTQATFVDDLDTLLSNSDVISMHCPLQESTHHLINAQRLSLMQSHTILLNISRGPVINEKALAQSLHQGRIGGAGIDVYEFEPSVDPDLLTAPNCTLLPHIASATHETRTAIGQLAANAIAGILNQKNPDDIPNLIPAS